MRAAAPEQRRAEGLHQGQCPGLPRGTCAMKPEDQGGMVDSRFRVHGVRNLRVVDASIFPRIPGYFIVTSIYMIAEKAADIMLGDATALCRH